MQKGRWEVIISIRVYKGEVLGRGMEKKYLIAFALFALAMIGTGMYFYYMQPISIEIDEIKKNITISERWRDVNLRVTGVSNVVRVDRDTSLANVTLLGIKNTIVLCSGIHQPNVTNQGFYGFVKFVQC